MESASSSSSSSSASKQQDAIITSDRVVSLTIRKGMESIALQTCAGLVIGGLAGVVLFRGGGGRTGTAGRKIFAALGAGIGLGSAWTRTSMNLEQAILGDGAGAGGAGKK